MSSEDSDELMELLDPGRIGGISKRMFCKVLLSLHKLRHQLRCSLDAQAEIIRVFRKVASFLITFVLALLFLLMVGVSPNMIVIGGAGVLSAAGIMLSKTCCTFISGQVSCTLIF